MLWTYLIVTTSLKSVKQAVVDRMQTIGAKPANATKTNGFHAVFHYSDDIEQKCGFEQVL